MRLVAILACAALTMPAIAFAQAGSTGGTIGKTDKSVSGGEERIEANPTPSPQKRRKVIDDKKSTTENKENAGCMKIVGSWDWLLGRTRIFLPTGRLPSSDRGGGTWTCKGDNYVVRFADGSEDRLKMSSDGNSMSGIGSATGWTISFTVHRTQ
jgi:hypothetical protein